MKDVTNAAVDAAAAAVPAPYGPLTRVDDFELFSQPGSNTRGKLTSALSVDVWLSLEELELPAMVQERMEELHGYTDVVARMKTAIGVLNTLAASMTTPHTYADYELLIKTMGEQLGSWTHGSLGP